MHPMIQAMINQRINQVSADELYEQAIQFNIPITRNQAARVAGRVRGKNIDLFQPAGQERLRRIFIEELGPVLAQELDQKFKQLMAKYQ